MPKKFRDLGLMPEIVESLESQGFESPFEIQELTIPHALEGKDVCGKAKTGSGKTLAFGLPILQLMPMAEPKRPTGLALVPTRELATQVQDELAPIAKASGRNILAVYGGANIEKQIAALAKGIDLVVATPGRLIDLIERKEVFLDDVAHVIVDEADRMADMGFLPQVEWLLRHVPGDHQTLLFSATLDGVVDRLTERYQHDPVRCEVDSKNVTVDEMAHRFITVHEMDRVKVVAEIARNSNRALVFSRTKHGADRLVDKLERENVKAEAIHGDRRQIAREKALARFSEGKLDVLVATDVAARGIHVNDVDVVIHLEPATDHKTYLHRSGRTARAGERGMAVTLALWNQELEVKRLVTRLGLDQPLVEMFSNDERLKDLHDWNPSDAD